MEYNMILKQIEQKQYRCPDCNKQLRYGTKHIAMQIQKQNNPILCQKCLIKKDKKLFYEIYKDSIKQAQHKYYEKTKVKK